MLPVKESITMSTKVDKSLECTLWVQKLWHSAKGKIKVKHMLRGSILYRLVQLKYKVTEEKMKLSFKQSLVGITACWPFRNMNYIITYYY